MKRIPTTIREAAPYLGLLLSLAAVTVMICTLVTLGIGLYFRFILAFS